MKKLPMYGVGPLYVGVCIGLTAAGVVIDRLEVIGRPELPVWVRALLCLFGAALILGGIALWTGAVLIARVDDGIKEDRLVTSGVYRWCRNPIYTAFLFLCTGALLLNGNLWLLALVPVFWLWMTVLMKHTEEKWLSEHFGEAYRLYQKQVNRVWPWPPEK